MADPPPLSRRHRWSFLILSVRRMSNKYLQSVYYGGCCLTFDIMPVAWRAITIRFSTHILAPPPSAIQHRMSFADQLKCVDRFAPQSGFRSSVSVEMCGSERTAIWIPEYIYTQSVLPSAIGIFFCSKLC